MHRNRPPDSYTPLWRQAIEQWPADKREEYLERVAIIMEGCASEGVTLEEAERRAFDCVSTSSK